MKRTQTVPVQSRADVSLVPVLSSRTNVQRSVVIGVSKLQPVPEADASDPG